MPVNQRDWAVGLTIICILCALTGLCGLYFSSRGVLQIVSADESETTVVQGVHRTADVFREKYEELKEDYFPVLLFQHLVRFGLGAGFLAGGTLLVMRHPKGRSFVFALCGVAIVYHLGNALLNWLVIISMGGVVEGSARSMLDAAGYVPDKEELVSAFMADVSFWAAIFNLALLVIRGCFYGWIMWYLSQPIVRGIFGENPYPSA
jgi:hypothetical protein